MILIRKAICGLLLLTGFILQGQGEYLTVGKDRIDLYIEDEGEGQPILFIPGWTMTSQFFLKQKEHFKKQYRYISYDPRSHGKSSKTVNFNTYKNHAIDLNDMILKLNLKNVVLVGWSSGCATIFEYVQLFGTQNLSHLVFIDEPPKWIGDSSKEWVYGSFEGYRESLKNLIEDRETYASGIASWMIQQDLDSVQENWMVNQMLMTPNDAALSLYIDGMVSDYNEVLVGLNGETPMLFMVRESWHKEVSNWLKTHVPDAMAISISSHAAFWEKSESFNLRLESFIKNKL